MLVNGTSMIRTRFAPSPSGFLHIGGVRTALFNYLYAKRFGGSFILRIDDTDASRNIEFAIKPLLRGLKWLGIEWDEGPIYQSNRKQHYKDVAVSLIKEGFAYPDQPSDNKLQKGTHRNMSPEIACALYDDTGWAIRFKIPEGTIVLDDLIRGKVVWNPDEIGDPVIIRSNGDATYNFATVVDDAEMKITHVIRAEEHLGNTSIQLLMMDALGYVPPFYAHVPYVCHTNSNKKLSKRDSREFISDETIARLNALGFSDEEISIREELNPVNLSYYESLGYKPSAIANYLVRLGWSLDDKTEIMSMEQMKKNFDLKRVRSSPARFDPVKLLWVNSEHVNQDHIDIKTTECIKYIQQAKILPLQVSLEDLLKIKQIVGICGDRIKCYSDILKYIKVFFQKPIFENADIEKYITAEILELMKPLLKSLENFNDWQSDKIEEFVKTYMSVRGKKPRDMVFAIRVSLCGNNIGPGLFETMEIIGKKECLERMNHVLNLYGGDSDD